ncbi:Uncharacterized protein HZ326_3035 [Fusarium oxysporum f. sp. albedinis]|nr:Uncharacterized protein HZ326_3035 [Fusarium oxysporum f. sp. albedinis]
MMPCLMANSCDARAGGIAIPAMSGSIFRIQHSNQNARSRVGSGRFQDSSEILKSESQSFEVTLELPFTVVNCPATASLPSPAHALS